MEKRLFLAVALSLGVVFLFQSFFNPKPKPESADSLAYSVDSQRSPTQAAGLIGSANKPLVKSSEIVNEKITEILKDGTRLSFSNLGGNISKVELLNYSYQLPVKNYFSTRIFDDKPFKLISSTPERTEYSYISNDWQVSKIYSLIKDKILTISLKIKNTSQQKVTFNDRINVFIMDMSRVDNSVSGADRTLFEYWVLSDKKNYRKNNLINFNEKWNKEERVDPLKLFGFRDRYFATVFQPKFDVNNYFAETQSANELALGFKAQDIVLLPDQAVDFDSLIYLGPQSLDLLGLAGPEFQKIMVFSDWGWLDAVSKAIYWSLGAMHKLIPDWGSCIILISFLIYALMYPLTLKSLVSMRKMQVVQPKIKQLQTKYKNSPEKLNQEVVAIYKQHGVNPLSGCLPMILQMPIFVGLYQVLWRSFYFRDQGFLWIKDLSQPDHLFKLPFEIPFLGAYLNILPILMAVIMSFQQRMSNLNVSADSDQAAQQKIMATFFPIFIGFIFYNFASGLSVYFVVFYFLSAVTQWKISKMNFSVANV